MKMSEAHFAVLEAAFKVFSAERLADHMQQYKAAGLSERRARFDAFWRVNRTSQEVRLMVQEFYSYGNDDHLHTALKRLMP